MLGAHINSCGVLVEDRIARSPVETLTSWVEMLEIDGESAAFIVFTDTMNSPPNRAPCGQALCDYIRSNRLGTVYATRAKLNPNSGNQIKVYTYALNQRSLRRWHRDHFPRQR